MKRLAIILIFQMTIALCAMAQEGLSVTPFLADNLQEKSSGQVTSVTITGEKLRNQDLSVYQSVAVTGDEALTTQIERAVTRDGAKALSREVSLKNGRLYFGFYSLRPSAGENRYLFFLNSNLTGGNKALLIYLQGKASAGQILQMLKK